VKVFKKLFLSILVIVISFGFVVSCGDIYSESKDSSSSDDSSEETSTTEADVFNLTMQIGNDETAINFCWYTNNDTISPKAIIQIVPAYSLSGSDFPESSSTEYEGTTTEPVVTESEEVGPPGRLISTSRDSESDDESISYLSNKVKVTGLLASTEYTYRVGDGTNFSAAHSFKTGEMNSYNFILVGDPQIGSSGSVSDDQDGWGLSVTTALSQFPNSSFILSVGDQINNSSSEDEYSAFFSPDELATIPFVTCIGNHDDNSLYQYHYNVPNESEDYGTTDAGGDYWFTYSNTLFMVLNSNNQSATSHETFIESAISDAGNNIIWKVVVLHHSIYSSARHSTDSDIISRRSDFYPIFDNNNIDIVMMGHDHVYSRSYQLLDNIAQKEQTTDTDGRVINPTGTLYLTLNSASGSKYYDLVETDTDYRAFRWQGYEPSYSNVEFTDTTFTVTTYTSDDNEVIDSYVIIKN